MDMTQSTLCTPKTKQSCANVSVTQNSGRQFCKLESISQRSVGALIQPGLTDEEHAKMQKDLGLLEPNKLKPDSYSGLLFCYWDDKSQSKF